MIIFYAQKSPISMMLTGERVQFFHSSGYSDTA